MRSEVRFSESLTDITLVLSDRVREKHRTWQLQQVDIKESERRRTGEVLCNGCGRQLEGDAELARGLCSLHTVTDKWAQGNRIWCDYFHRGVEIVRVDNFAQGYGLTP